MKKYINMIDNYLEDSDNINQEWVELLKSARTMFLQSGQAEIKHTINIKKINPNAIIPTQANYGDAGFDIYACFDGGSVEIKPHETVKIHTGISIEIPIGWFGGVYARSGLATKQGLRPANCVGVCDSPYRGEYMVSLHNDSNEIRTVKSGDRIAQLIIQPCMFATFNEVDELSYTERGNGGFGSTGR